MASGSPFSSGKQALMPSSNLEIPMEKGSQSSERLIENEVDDLESGCDQVLDFENAGDFQSAIDDEESGPSQGTHYTPPAVGMEFESYDDAYNYYNSYAKELGFAIRIKSSWTKRNSKEKRGAVLCCNCEGFKTIKEANSRRKETRTGCLAMIRLRLVESNRWRVDDVRLDHNHSFDLERAQNSKSHKKMDVCIKRKVEPDLDVEVRTIKLYRTPVVDSNSDCENSHHVDLVRSLNLNKGDLQFMTNFFCRAQLTDPNFFYSMDLNDEGYFRNVFWIDSWSRAAYVYFSDVVLVDTTCLSNKFEIPLLSFVGVNHHGRPVLLGCALLADESLQTYIWLFRVWLTCMSGRSPQTMIIGQGEALKNAIAEVFPRARHCLCLSFVMQWALQRLGHSHECKALEAALSRIVYHSLTVDEFLTNWEDMIQRFGATDLEWLRTLYEDRERWAPVYLMDVFFAGMFHFQQDEAPGSFFEGYLHKKTLLKEFLNIHDSAMQRSHEKEALDDFESGELAPELRSKCYYELQLSKIYTKEIFSRFQVEVEMMSSCLGITQIHADGPLATYLVKEHGSEGNVRAFEVMYDKVGAEIRCMCGCFNFKGYLCRHALCVLEHDGVEEIPFQYVVSRWRKDFKRLYVPYFGSRDIDISNQVQWFDQLHKQALVVVQEGMVSGDHSMAAWQMLKESLTKVRLVTDGSYV